MHFLAFFLARDGHSFKARIFKIEALTTGAKIVKLLFGGVQDVFFVFECSDVTNSHDT